MELLLPFIRTFRDSNKHGSKPEPLVAIMNRTLIFVFGFLALSSYGQEVTFGTSIWQYGEEKIPVVDVVLLSKDTFELRITNNFEHAVVLNASFDSRFFDLKKSDSIPEFKSWVYRCGAESEFNESKSIVLDTITNHYWRYHPYLKTYKYDSIINLSDKNFTGIRTITRYTTWNGKEMVDTPINQIDDDVFWFFIIIRDYKVNKSAPFKELSRARLKIEWLVE